MTVWEEKKKTSLLNVCVHVHAHATHKTSVDDAVCKGTQNNSNNNNTTS